MQKGNGLRNKKVVMKYFVVTMTLLGCVFASFAKPFFELDSEKNIVLFQEQYKEITLNKVPESIKRALKNTFPGAILDKVFVDDNKEYKLEISVASQQTTVYSDVEGNWIVK
jgi:hypothetical protein